MRILTSRIAGRSLLAPLALTAALGCGELDILNTNAPTLETLTGAPTRAVLARAATGIFSQAYNDVATEVTVYALYGREGYNLLGNDPRETQEQFRGPPDPTGRHSANWIGPYQTIRTVNTYLKALPAAAGMTPAEVKASQGFAKTVKAWMLHRVAVRTGALGVPIDVDQELGGAPAPFVSFATALQAATTLMDEAYADLLAGGAAFPFTVAPGYTGFNTPATFARFNRALAAKMYVHRATFVNCTACWAQASTAMGLSFVTDAGLPASLATGVLYQYSTAANEPTNPVTELLTSQRYWVHPSIVNGAQSNAGVPDRRLTTKVRAAGRTLNLNDLVGTHKPVMYNSATDPTQANLGAAIPWINNEELLLLRAEIRWFTGAQAGAVSDINLVRQHAGGLGAAAVTAASSNADFITELLYNRTYSLMWTQGTRWIDARRHGRTTSLPLDRPGDIIYPNMIVPAAECDARRLPTPCTPLTS
ncbi:MAG: RagB/SusD family nutrient uptake outer membrane protein [Gemmatimonadetes bacterium]|nr:RagB/SusD family nutrient uptake outer membrane protein [Gemmatimonadota bacterium]